MLVPVFAHGTLTIGIPFSAYVLIDHTMTVRAKPWTLDSNSNSNNCDGSNNTIDGWSGGDTNDFLQQLVACHIFQ